MGTHNVSVPMVRIKLPPRLSSDRYENAYATISLHSSECVGEALSSHVSDRQANIPGEDTCDKQMENEDS